MANDFSADENCVALWSFESGALTADSIGGNTLTNTGVVANTIDYREKAASADIERDDSDKFTISDAALDAGFPFKSGDTTKKISICCWIRPEDLINPSVSPLFSKWASGKGSFELRFYCGGSNYFQVGFAIGHSGGGTLESVLLDQIFSTDTGDWFHIGVTYQDSDRSYRIRVYDETADTVYDRTGNTTNNINVEDAGVTIGMNYILSRYDGLLDEMVIFNDILSASQIDAIRGGTFGSTLPSAPPLIWFSSTADTSSLHGRAIFRPATLPLVERLTWKTQILRGADGSEQRIAHAAGIPRQSFVYPLVSRTQRETNELEYLLHYNLKGQWFIPVWPEAEMCMAPLAAGAGTIPVDTRYADFRAANRAIVFQNPDCAEVVRVSTVANDSLTLSGTLVNSYTGPYWVMPCRHGNIIGAVSKGRHVGGSSITEASFEVINNIAITGHTAALTYDGFDVLTEPGRFMGDEQESSEDGDVYVIDAGTGKMETLSVSDFNVGVQSHIFVNDSKAKAWAFRQWLHAVVGRQKAFLVPTFQPDLPLVFPLASDDTTLTVAKRGATIMGLNTLRTYIAIRPPGGTLIPRKVTDISTSGDYDIITIDAGPGVTVGTDALVCWADKCRLANDTVELQWYRLGKNICETQLVRIDE